MLLLPEPEVYHLLCHLSRSQAVRFLDSLRAALVLYSDERNSTRPDKLLHQPLRSSIVTGNNNTTLFMPSSDTHNTGLKVITLPSDGGTTGVNMLLAPTGQILGLVGASQVTAFRTALATMTLFTRVTHIPKRHIVIFGSGKQVEWHIRLAVLSSNAEIEAITVINRGRRRLDQLERTVLGPLRLTNPSIKWHLIAKEDTPDFESVLRSQLGSADAIFCCTPSGTPLFPFCMLESSPKRRFISLIGSYKRHMKEVDTDTLLSGSSRIFVDSIPACLEESGELIDAKANAGQLIEIGTHVGNAEAQYPEGNVVLKCVGMGIMDLVVSRLLLDVAKELGTGQEVQGL